MIIISGYSAHTDGFIFLAKSKDVTEALKELELNNPYKMVIATIGDQNLLISRDEAHKYNKHSPPAHKFGNIEDDQDSRFCIVHRSN